MGSQTTVELRSVLDADLPIFFQQQLDPQANHMAAFTSKDPSDRAAFEAHWARIRKHPDITNRTILWEGQVAGNLAKFMHDDRPEVSYWLGREYWGKGIATRALGLFLTECSLRPLYASVAKDNHASIQVLRRNGFQIWSEGKGYAQARKSQIEEWILILHS